jgi:AcrR family transcriptional regulator
VFQAAVRVFVARGYDNATMQDIAAEAGVARRTVFYHFAAKGDIAVEWAIRRGRQASGLIRQASPSQPVPERVRAYFHELAVMTEQDWEETRQLMAGLLRGHGTPGHRPWLAAEMVDWLRDRLSDQPGCRLPGKAADPALATEALYDVFQGALLRWMGTAAPEPRRFTAEADAVVAIVLAGLGYQPGPE